VTDKKPSASDLEEKVEDLQFQCDMLEREVEGLEARLRLAGRIIALIGPQPRGELYDLLTEWEVGGLTR
jgi:hypothetical protein